MISRRGAPNLSLSQKHCLREDFCRKLHENERNLTGGTCVPGVPSLDPQMEKFWVPSSPKFLQVMFSIYRPQRSCGTKLVIFSQLSVILFTGGGVSQHALGQTPPLGRHTPPRADNPLGRHPSRQTPHRYTPPPGQTPSHPPPATAADGTHPTGMHSCFDSFDKTEFGKN